MRYPIILLALALLLGLAATAKAQGFGPKTYADCVMVNAKRAASRDGGMLMRRACKCRFQDPKASECRQYSQTALDCMIGSLVPVERDEEAWGVERACRNKHPVQ
ncbi:MAG: hypothetical protein ACP59X_05095 [Solidesulfovibrio sp. DCME]|uniref:hypothetical protein n=1 Tax=Solidesulfovibrio sp. DCME TaxID=3447380 RepID=UPI003D103230